MNADYSLLMQKVTDGAPLMDLEDDFDMVCLSFPFAHSNSRKEPAFNDWPDEDGEDVYTGGKIYRNAYDIEAEFGYKGHFSGVYTAVKKFVDYLDGTSDGCGFLKVYQNYTKIGRNNVYLKEFGDSEFFVQQEEGVITFKLTFRVCDPTSEIIYTGTDLAVAP